MTEQDMTNSDNVTPAPVDGADSAGAAQRQAPNAQLAQAFSYMLSASSTEFRRGSDKTNAIVLPVACGLLIIAMVVAANEQARAVPYLAPSAFLAPLIAFIYYISVRIGIVNTMNTRQAYLTFHILIATFLLGGTVSLFLLLIFIFLWVRP